MPGRATPLVNGEFYHIFNRGTDKRSIFTKPKDYYRFKETFRYYRFSGLKPKFSNTNKAVLKNLNDLNENKLIDIVCYCLMPNHFHFLLKQLKDSGISNFISQVSNSYTKYFNIKYKRTGSLLEGKFKSVHVSTDEQLTHLSRYIHLNPVVAKISTLDSYAWSSYHEYMNEASICSTNDVLNFFRSNENYKQFLIDRIDYGQQLEIVKHLLIDEN